MIALNPTGAAVSARRVSMKLFGRTNLGNYIFQVRLTARPKNGLLLYGHARKVGGLSRRCSALMSLSFHSLRGTLQTSSCRLGCEARRIKWYERDS